jgi:hypothetical protein
MRAKLVTISLTLFVAATLLFEVSAFTALAQDSPTDTTAPQKASRKKVTKRGSKAKMMKGVPKGVTACLEHLTEMASQDPLPAYEGHPEEIVNNGLMWNDPKSKCSIGTDQALRNKVSQLANAWRMKKADEVRSLLQEIKSAAPQS